MAPPKVVKNDVEEGVTREKVLNNYVKVSKVIGVPTNPHIIEAIRGHEDEKDPKPFTQLVLNEDAGSLGSGGSRALTSAFLGSGPGLTSGPYKFLKSIRIWKCSIGNDGAPAFADLLIQGNAEMDLTYLEFIDCNIGPEGCKALAEALDKKHKIKLLTLNFNYNSEIADAGTHALCQGLFSNSVLKQLHLEYCNVGEDGATKLGQVISMPTSQLSVLSLQGNAITEKGLRNLCMGLKRSRTLEKLNLSANAVGKTVEAVTAMCEAIEANRVLKSLDFTYNHMEPSHAELLVPVLEHNNVLTTFLVDSSLPSELFGKLNRGGGDGDGQKKSSKKKTGGGKKKKGEK